MDKLKEIMTKQKPKEKIVVNKESRQKERQAYLAQLEKSKQEKKEAQEKRLQEIQQFYASTRKTKTLEPQPPLSPGQVKTKLRELYQPITIFGQSNYKRYQRYTKAKQFHENNPNEDMKLYDEQFAKKLKYNEQFEELDAKYRQQLIEPRILDNISFRQKKMKGILNQKGKRDFNEMCDEVYLWISKVLNEWSHELQLRNHDKKHLEDVRRKFQIYHIADEELKSLKGVLKLHTGDKQMITSIYNIMNCCLVREYVQANDKYLQLSVGTAPWPMGEAMLSITVRKNSQKLSHVLDQEITRKWMQGIKRLISVSEQLFPNEQQIKMTRFTTNKMV